MSRRVIAGVAAVGVAILASCSQDRSPNVSLPTEASLASAPTAPTCSFSKATTDAKNYFTNTTGRTPDEVFALLNVMQGTTAGTTERTTAGFAVLNRLAVARDAGLVKTTVTATAAGVAFANDVLLCMPNMTPIDARALDTKGLFEVRDGNSTAPVTSLPVVFGAQPTPVTTPLTAKWPLAGKTLFTGWPVNAFTTPAGATPIGDPTAGTVFELRTQPSGFTSGKKILVGVCDISAPTVPGQTARILHLHGSPLVLGTNVDPTFCPTTTDPIPPLLTNASAPSSMFAYVAKQVASWLSPKPAYAASRAMMVTLLRGGGTVGGLSEFGPIQFQDTLEFQKTNGVAIPDAKVSDATDGDPATIQFQPIIAVTALSKAGGLPLANVEITLEVTGNKGSYTPPGGNAVALTGPDGVAYFPNFMIDKSGGYTVQAKATGFGSTGAATSNLFNVSGQ